MLTKSNADLQKTFKVLQEMGNVNIVNKELLTVFKVLRKIYKGIYNNLPNGHTIINTRIMRRSLIILLLFIYLSTSSLVF